MSEEKEEPIIGEEEQIIIPADLYDRIKLARWDYPVKDTIIMILEEWLGD